VSLESWNWSNFRFLFFLLGGRTGVDVSIEFAFLNVKSEGSPPKALILLESNCVPQSADLSLRSAKIELEQSVNTELKSVCVSPSGDQSIGNISKFTTCSIWFSTYAISIFCQIVSFFTTLRYRQPFTRCWTRLRGIFSGSRRWHCKLWCTSVLFSFIIWMTISLL
jgi:hypothetical protein